MRGLLLLAVLAACEAKRGEPSGIGHWRFGHTTAGDAKKEGLCDKTTASDGRNVTWCHQMPPLKITNRNTSVDIYFEGHEDSGKMIEIQLNVQGCIEDDLDRWLRSAFGPPKETRATRAYWQNSFMWIAALMPSQPGRCLIHFLPLSEQSEIDRIKGK
jgi:hypothetical protein